MKPLITFVAMVLWSVAIWAVIELIGFKMHDILSSLGAAVLLLVGLIGNVWIYFLIMKEDPWRWITKSQD